MLTSSIKRELNEKQMGSVIHNRTFVASKSLDDSKKWYEREILAQMERGGLFEDPFMSPNDPSLWSGKSSSKYRWLRPCVGFMRIYTLI